MSLCLLTMFKNESHIMKEYITHYLQQGVDHFFMIDNGSNDDYLEYLNPYINNHTVDLIVDPERNFQVNGYNMYFRDKIKQYDWVIVCDLDEFIYARKHFKTIKEYLNTIDGSISQVFIPWKMFGSNGFNTIEHQQPESVIKNFVKRQNYKNNEYIFHKSIVRTKYLIEFYIHYHTTENNNYISSHPSLLNDPFSDDLQFSKISEDILENSYLHLNHYPIQSFNWFMKIKATRGDADNISKDNVRDEKYFYGYDAVSNDIVDLELCNISNNKDSTDIKDSIM